MSMIAVIARNDLRRRLSQPVSLLVWTGVPLMIGLLMAAMGAGGGIGPKAHVLLVDEDSQSVAGLLLRGAAGLQKRVVIEKVDEAEGHRRLAEGDATALLILPAGFDRAILDEAPATVDLITNPGEQILPDIVEELADAGLEMTWTLRRLLDEPIEELRGKEDLGFGDAAALAPAVERLADEHLPPLLEMELAPSLASRPAAVRFGAVILPGLVMMALLLAAGGLSDDIWVEREAGTLVRYLASPHSIASLLAGKLAAAAVVMLVLSLAGLGISAAVAGGAWRGLPLAVVVAVLTGTVFVALYMLIQASASSRRTGNVLTTIVMFPLLMVGGSFFPLDQLPGAIGWLGSWTPNGRALTVIQQALLRESGNAATVLLALAGLGTVACVLLARRLAHVELGG